MLHAGVGAAVGVGIGHEGLGIGVKAGKTKQDRCRVGGFGAFCGMEQAVNFRERGMIVRTLLRRAEWESGWRTGIGGLGLVELALDIVAWSTRGG